MLYTIFWAFLALVVYQTFAKKVGLPLVSNGLENARDVAVQFWDWLGLTVGKLLNIMEWWDTIYKFLESIWNFVKDLWNVAERFFLEIWRLIKTHIWGNIRPLVDSVEEIGRPLWQLLFSWGYFFVGLSRTHYIVFSWLGGSTALALTYGYWGHLLYEWFFWVVTSAVAGFAGILIAFPGILPDMFPRVTKFFAKVPEPTVVVHNIEYNY